MEGFLYGRTVEKSRSKPNSTWGEIILIIRNFPLKSCFVLNLSCYYGKWGNEVLSKPVCDGQVEA